MNRREEFTASSDAEVIRASLEDPELFELIFSRHYELIHRYLVRRCGMTAGPDLAAETFEHAFRSRESFRGSASCRGWLFGIAANKARMHARSDARRRRLSLLAGHRDRATTSDELSDIEWKVDASALVAQLGVVEALRSLNEIDREALLMRAFADLTYPELAEVFDIPVGTVRSRLNRARRVMREAMNVDLLPADLEVEP